MTTPTLTREQERVALTLIKQGDEDSKNLFVYYNQPLVGKVASHYRDKGLTWDELIAAGNVGLVQAINRFDIESGNKFSTFAVPWIKGEILQAFKDAKGDKHSDRRILATENGVPLVFDAVSEQVLIEDEALQKIAAKDLQAQNEPESEELADHADLQEAVEADAECKEDGGLGLNAAQARSEGYGSSAGCAEFGNLRGEDPKDDGKPGGGYAINLAPDEGLSSIGVDSDLIPALEEAVERLEDPRQSLVFRMRLGLGGHDRHTFKQIGDALDISLQRAEAIFKATFSQLRNDETLEMLFQLIQ